MHQLTTRPQTPEESQRIARRARSDVGSYVYLAAFFGAISVVYFGILGVGRGGFAAGDVVTVARWVGWTAVTLVCIWSFVSLARCDRQLSRLAAEDVDAGLVEEVHVAEPRVVEIALLCDAAPILAFEIGEGKILFLQGQWLRDPVTYGTELPDDDEYAEYVNGLPEPYAFPSTQFTLTRFPKSGMILGIRVEGGYLKPEKTVDVLKPEYDFGESALIDGALDDLAEVLAWEHERRKAR